MRAQIPAIVIPFRNRDRYLEVLLQALPRYLERTNDIGDFTIYVSEQTTPDLFNLSLSRNVGAAFALAEGRCDYFVYDPTYAGWGAEDTDFGCRLTTLGHDARLWHHTEEAKDAVVCNLELPDMPDAGALAWSRRYFGLTGPHGPRFVIPGAPPRLIFETPRRRGWHELCPGECTKDST